MTSLNRSLAPLLQEPGKVDLIQARSFSVSQGVNIHWIQAGVQPVVKLEFIFPANNSKAFSFGVAQFGLKLLAEGTKNYSSQQIKEAFAFFGAHLDVQYGVDRSSFVIHTLSKHLKSIVPLVMEILDNPTFPEEELLTLKKNTIQNIKINSEKTSILAQIAFKEALYGKYHPYGHSLTIEEVESVTIDTIKEYYAKEIKHSMLDVIVSGYLSDSEFALIQNGLRNWVAQPELVTAIGNSSELVGSNNIVQKKGSLQASIRLGGRSLSKSDPDYFNIVIVNKILGGYFGSRLMKNLREDKGYTYGISSALVNLEYANHWIVGADVRNDVVKDAVKEIYKEINILANHLIPEPELETVKRYMIGTFISSSNTPFQLSDKFKNIYFSNLGYEYYENYFLAINRANPKDLLESANNWLSKPNIVEVISGDIN